MNMEVENMECYKITCLSDFTVGYTLHYYKSVVEFIDIGARLGPILSLSRSRPFDQDNKI